MVPVRKMARKNMTVVDLKKNTTGIILPTHTHEQQEKM
jgi:hypothetical protein